MKKTSYFLIGIFVFLIFVLFSYFVHKDLFTHFDFDTTVRIQDKMPRRFDSIFSYLSLIGSFEVISIVLFAALVLTKKIRSVFIIGFYGALHIFELYGKFFVDHPGPPYLFFRYDIPFQFPTSYVQPGSSYPSGHAARAAFVSIILLFIVGKSKKITNRQKSIIYSLILLFDISMFVSRVYLGEHWSSDVIGGVLLGLGLGISSLIVL